MNLDDTYQSLKESYIDWTNFLINPRFKKDSHNHKISWNNYCKRKRSNILRRSDIIDMGNNKQYSLQIIEDGSLIQIFYEFERNNHTLTSANLGYFNAGGISYDLCQELQYPELSPTDITPEAQPLGLFEDNNSFEDDPIIAWIRIDYSPHNYCSPLHHSCHMHLSLFEYARIPLTGVPSPRQFIEFIISMCYPEIYTNKRLDMKYEPNNVSHIISLNSKYFPFISSDVYQMLPHFNIPTH